MKSAEAIVTLIQFARGERRYSFESREAEEVLNIALALLSELGVAFDRIDRLERIVADRVGMPLEELRSVDFADGPVAAERDDAISALVARVLRIGLDPRARAYTRE